MGTSSIFAAARDGMRTISGPLLDLSLSRGKSQSYAVIRSIAPVGIVVPLHGHDEPETMVVVEGVLEAWLDGAWNRYKKGEVIDIASNVPHALRNSGHEEVALVLVTTPRMARFFDEISVSQAQADVTPERLAHIAKIAAAYGFWSASPEQQAAIGIVLPE
ncbi:cupin domain-containing protein [Rhizobium laguerreae]|uniref:Cupin domain n=3 Tax=Rhizobium laguerreae TaxID=1076926 RepID=A0AAX2QCR8_9HYPH|nr:cupin domain-containing protein [Rhizobium laguerreae]NKM20987.1 cupin domain-containing protein [Rhizobium laguerreae]NKM28205.1 cupin domain-containing protein [Rhizobium laguerreae]NNH85601.1 cupin domain-containing protein [Rhizobium laguerreae]TCU14238.1 cupin domain [Rhizobium laguerreae]